MELVFATNNANKAREINQILGNSFNILTLKDIGFEGDIPETQPTLEGNALQKARYIVDRYNVACFADDTGLEISALNGAPGVYSARYAGPERSAEANMAKVLSGLAQATDRSAQFRTAIALILDGVEHVFEGKVEGRIGTEKSGAEGFGYDPIFYPEDADRTFAEMSPDEKNAVSHRQRAVTAMVEFLRNRG